MLSFHDVLTARITVEQLSSPFARISFSIPLVELRIVANPDKNICRTAVRVYCTYMLTEEFGN